MSLYFALDKTGYNRTQPPTLPTDHSKHLPVYKIISEPMHPKPRPVQTIAEQQQQIDLAAGQKSSRSLDLNLHKKAVKYVLMNTQRLMEKQQVNSIYEGQSPDPQQKNPSIQDTNASMIHSFPRNSQLKFTSVDVSKGKTITNTDGFNDRSQLESELNKERVLRNNLQKSYNSLMQRLKLDSTFFEEGTQEHQTAKQSLTPSSRVTARYGQQAALDEDKDQTLEEVGSKRLRRSCCEAKAKKVEGEDEMSESEQAQNDFIDHLQNQENFKSKLCEELLLCEDRIDSIESHLAQRQKQLQKASQQITALEKENEMLKSTAINQQTLVCHHGTNNRFSISIHQHLHYIFTILILFLVIVLLTKKQI